MTAAIRRIDERMTAGERFLEHGDEHDSRTTWFIVAVIAIVLHGLLFTVVWRGKPAVIALEEEAVPIILIDPMDLFPPPPAEPPPPQQETTPIPTQEEPPPVEIEVPEITPVIEPMEIDEPALEMDLSIPDIVPIEPEPPPVQSGPFEESARGLTPAVRTVVVDPDYPPVARRARIPGRAVLRGIIGIDGRIRELVVLMEDPEKFGFAEKAIEAAEQWHYMPARFQGQDVEQFITITANFTID